MDVIPYPFLKWWSVAPFQCAPKGTEVQLIKEVVSADGIMVTNPILPSLLWPSHVCQISAIPAEHESIYVRHIHPSLPNSNTSVGSFIQHPTTVYGDCALRYMRFVPRIEDKIYFISKCAIFSTDQKVLQNSQFLYKRSSNFISHNVWYQCSWLACRIIKV
jgi:hypothetical protein